MSRERVPRSSRPAPPRKRRRPRTGLGRGDLILGHHIIITDSAHRLAVKVHGDEGGLALVAGISDSRPLARMVLNLKAVLADGGSVTHYRVTGGPLIETVGAGIGEKLSILYCPIEQPLGADNAAAETPPESKPPQVPYVHLRRKMKPDVFAIVLDGDCMEPKYHSGDVVLVSRSAPVKSGDDCMVISWGPDGRTQKQMKRVWLLADGAIRLQPRNPRYKPFILEANQVMAIIRVVGRAPRAAIRLPASGPAAPPTRCPAKQAKPDVAAPIATAPLA